MDTQDTADLQSQLNRLNGHSTITHMPFGKHKGTAIADLDAGYIAWLLANCTSLRPDLREALEGERQRRPAVPQKTRQMIAVMPFGKYKGEPLIDLPSGYIEWLLENCDLHSALRSALEAVWGS